MKYVHEFRDPQRAQGILRQIEAIAAQLPPGSPGSSVSDRPLRIMEICGGHTHAIFKYGLADLLPDSIDLIHGPGCPVCIMPKGRLDDAITLAQNPQVILTTFGDVLRVPGSSQSLLQAKAQGADIRVVYSPLDALQIAIAHPDREVVFFAIGFETTAPSTALTVLQAAAQGVSNFSLFCNHVLVVPALEALLNQPDLQLDGFIGPGHVSMVIGARPYRVIAERYGKPVVVSGFEPVDILQSLWMVLDQLVTGRCTVENQYSRLVAEDGNAVALGAIAQVFTVREQFEWRGLGEIPASGLRIHPDYAQFDAEVKFSLPHPHVDDHRACACGDILRGVKKPWECKVFGTACTPDSPLGACMVSSEGACAAYYNYGQLDRRRPATSSASPAPSHLSRVRR
ncbi:MAG: hydrogenase formation protein HypD [Synechococcales cyanobacterium K44_A2020_017]|nr:hydrogenase formation protein HypD [Synechococcales cyanobacterium K44_A2020_017]